jgi:hypothetical protein
MNTSIFRPALTLALLAACTAESPNPVTGIEPQQPKTQAPLSVTDVPTTAQPFGAQFTVSSAGGSGTGAVSFAASGACSNSAGGAVITVSAGSGTCSVTATKAADASYRSATSPSATVAASRAAQAPLRVTNMPTSDQVQGATFTVGSAGGSGTGAVNFAAAGACSVGTTSGAVEITSGSGSCSIIAVKEADANHESATSEAAEVRVVSNAQQPPPGTGIAGMYMGLRVNFDGKQYSDYYTFLADGRAFRSTPDEGLARPVDWAAICAASECGTYSVSGNQLAFQREGADIQLFSIGSEGVLRKPQQTQGYRKMHQLDDVQLAASYGFVSAGDTIAAITFQADGRFRERGILAWTAWTPPSGGAAPARGAGMYSIIQSTLELRYDGGPTVYMVLAVPPGVAPSTTPESVYLRRTTLGRLP